MKVLLSAFYDYWLEQCMDVCGLKVSDLGLIM